MSGVQGVPGCRKKPVPWMMAVQRPRVGFFLLKTQKFHEQAGCKGHPGMDFVHGSRVLSADITYPSHALFVHGQEMVLNRVRLGLFDRELQEALDPR